LAQERGLRPLLVTFVVTILCFFCFYYVKTTTSINKGEKKALFSLEGEKEESSIV